MIKALRWRSVLFWTVLVLLLVYRPLSAHGIPFAALISAKHDDGLLYRLALELRNGNWLGEYDATTLCKGPFYSMFVALARDLSVPLPVFEQSFYAAIAVVAVWSVRPAVSSRLLLSFGLALLIFNPSGWGTLPARFTRDVLAGQLGVLCMAGVVGMILRRERSRIDLAIWAALAGTAGGACWMTREEGVWVIVPAAMLLGAGVVAVLWAGTARLSRAAVIAVVPLIFGMLPVLSVCEQNRRHYDVFAVVDMKAKEFQDAYGALLRVGEKHYRHYVPVPAAAREAMYQVSPTLRQIQPLMEGPLGKGWIPHQPAMPDPQDLQGGWFIWAFRECARRVGGSGNGPPLEFYRNVADEVNAACDAGLLDSGSERSTLVTPLQREDLPRIWRSLVKNMKTMAVWPLYESDSFSFPPAEPEGVIDLVGTPLTTPEHRNSIIGWACAADGPVTLAVRTSAGRIVRLKPQWTASPDVAEHLRSIGKRWATGKHARFMAVAPSDVTDLILYRKERASLRVPLAGASGATASNRFAAASVDRYVADAIPTMPATKRAVHDIVCQAVRYTGSVLTFATVGWFVLGLITIRRNLLWMCITGAAAGAVCLRSGLLAYVDATTYPAWSQRYNGPTFTMLGFLLFLAMCALYQHFRRCRSLQEQAVSVGDGAPEISECSAGGQR